ncbi:MAG: hypothetical protein MUC92_10245 [Fimbriimonadaceae bacterium]|jgi:glycerophosphoryl diester phosphodiesterase|nr:hypothetical protein [Fimbriimonadaceae bacterium]
MITATLCLLLTEPAFSARQVPDLSRGLHRGGYSHWPENTAFGFAKAAEILPLVLLETDVAGTKDGIQVLLHDETVDRTTNGKGKLADLTFDEVRGLDAGYSWKNSAGETPFKGKGITVPTLREALLAAPQNVFLVDLKPASDPAKVVQIIQELGAESRVILASFIPAKIAEARRLAPTIATCADTNQAIAMLSALRGKNTWDRYKPTFSILSLMKEHRDQFKVTDAEFRKIREKGILIHIHTLDTKEEIDEWKRIGVDGFLTSRSDLVLRGLPKQGD